MPGGHTAVTQVATLVQFVTSSVNAVADLNANLAAVRNQFNSLVTASNTLISGLTIPSPTITTLAVSGTTTLTGNVGVGNVSDPSVGLWLRPSLATTTQSGMQIQPTFTSAATSSGYGQYIAINTAVAAFTLTNAYGQRIVAPGVGAGSAITNLYGLYIENQTAGGTLNYAIYTNLGPIRFGDSMQVTGPVSITAAVAKILGGATSLSLRNNADTNDNWILTDAGNATLRGTLTLSSAASQIIPGATSLSLRNNANNADNFILTDAGNATLRGNLTFASATTKIAVPAAGSTDFRAASDLSSVLLILDTGAVQLSTGRLTTIVPTTATAGLRLQHGVAPTSPLDGDIWSTTAGLFIRVNGVTKTVTLT